MNFDGYLMRSAAMGLLVVLSAGMMMGAAAGAGEAPAVKRTTP